MCISLAELNIMISDDVSKSWEYMRIFLKSTRVTHQTHLFRTKPYLPRKPGPFASLPSDRPDLETEEQKPPALPGDSGVPDPPPECTAK